MALIWLTLKSTDTRLKLNFYLQKNITKTYERLEGKDGGHVADLHVDEVLEVQQGRASH